MTFSSEIKFSEVTIDVLEETFQLVRDYEREVHAYQKWRQVAEKQDVLDAESFQVEHLKRLLMMFGTGWNETELESRFIGPIIDVAQIQDTQIGYFMGRKLEAICEDIKLFGEVDGLVAKGTHTPKVPYFCLQEFKREKDPKGDPKAQVLAAMLAAQALNEGRFPVYGLYVIGLNWWFVLLKGKKYTVSESLGADGDDVYIIFKMLKALKVLIVEHLQS